MRHRLGQFVTLLSILVTAAGAYNVLGDNQEVEAMAKKSVPACTAGCTVARVDRSPLAQEFQLAPRAGATATVRCTRAAYLVGSYACAPR
jgi:hypothetical protein